MIKIKFNYLLLFIIIFMFVGCSKENRYDSNEEQNSVESIKNSNQMLSKVSLVDNAITLLNSEYKKSIDSTHYQTTLSINSADNRDYDVYVFDNGNEQFSASYDILTKEFVFLNMFGTITNSKRDVTLSYLDSNKTTTIVARAMPMEGNCNEGESCTGCHYRVMREIINQDGDSAAACDALDILDICVAQTYIAAFLHCWFSH